MNKGSVACVCLRSLLFGFYIANRYLSTELNTYYICMCEMRFIDLAVLAVVVSRYIVYYRGSICTNMYLE